jgi:hypothetical protein
MMEGHDVAVGHDMARSFQPVGRFKSGRARLTCQQ